MIMFFFCIYKMALEWSGEVNDVKLVVHVWVPCESCAINRLGDLMFKLHNFQLDCAIVLVLDFNKEFDISPFKYSSIFVHLVRKWLLFYYSSRQLIFYQHSFNVTFMLY